MNQHHASHNQQISVKQWLNWQSFLKSTTKFQKSSVAQCPGYIGSPKLWCKWNQYHHSKRNSRWYDDVLIHRYHNKSRRSYQISNWILKFNQSHALRVLTLTFCVSIIILENINPQRLYNGTKLSVKIVDEQYYRSHKFNREVENRRCTVAKHPCNDFNRYAFQVQIFVVVGATCLCNE